MSKQADEIKHKMLNGAITLAWKDGKRTVHSPGSNFWVEENGTCVEVDFQAAKHALANPFRAAAIKNAKSPAEAKRLGRKFRLNKQEIREWDERKLDVMLELIRAKASTSQIFRNWLKATSDFMIIEYNWWHDQFWGDCTCEKHFYRHGANHLGIILMQVRSELGR